MRRCHTASVQDARRCRLLRPVRSIHAAAAGTAGAAGPNILRVAPPQLPQPLKKAWQLSNRQSLDAAIHQPVLDPGTGAAIHLLGITHKLPTSTCRVWTVLNAVKPDAVALELEPARLTKAVSTAATRVSGVVKKLSHMEGPHDAFHLISHAEQAAWNREGEAIKWVLPLSEDSVRSGNLVLAEILPAVLWGLQHKVPVTGIDGARGQPQLSQMWDAIGSLATHSQPLQLLATIRQSRSLVAAGAEEWWSYACECPVGGSDSEGVCRVQKQMALLTLVETLSEHHMQQFEGQQQASNPEAYAELVLRRDIIMAQRLVAMCRPAAGRSKGRAPARVVVASMGAAHVVGVRQQLLRLLY